MRNKWLHYVGLSSIAMGLSGCGGQAFPLVFMDKTTVGIDVSGPGVDTASASISVGVSMKKVAIVPVAIGDQYSQAKDARASNTEDAQKNTASNEPPAKGTKENPKFFSSDTLKNTFLNTGSTLGIQDSTTSVVQPTAAAIPGSAVAQSTPPSTPQPARKNVRASPGKAIVGSGEALNVRTFHPILSDNHGKKDALSVLGQFSTNTYAGRQSAGVGLGQFFATGSAAVTLADGFKAQLSQNCVPIANNDAYSLAVGASLTGLSVTANDVCYYKVGLTTQPASGTLKLEGDGSFTFSPAATSGKVSFDYVLTNAQGQTAAATATIDVTAAPTPTSPQVPKVPTLPVMPTNPSAPILK